MPARASGVLLHPTSLPGPYGVGDLGPEASSFLAWLEAAGQSIWQILPLGPTGLGNSPYNATSSFAGNPLLISPDRLAEEGLIPSLALASAPTLPPARLDHGRALAWKAALLKISWRHFQRDGSRRVTAEMDAFLEEPEQAGWLDDWALYTALKNRFSQSSWVDWPQELRLRDGSALAQARRRHAPEIRFAQYLQFLFHKQLRDLRAEAAERGIELFGDLPMYVALDSADVWSNQHYFALDPQGRPTAVAGVPPDYFSSTGQLWGNPIYRWDRLREDRYSWWIDRLAATMRQTDRVRLDHFRAFSGYWSVPADAPTAAEGEWVQGPGEELFQEAGAALGAAPLVAEDLGVITPDVRRLRRSLGIPGTRVLQFGFGDPESEHLPHNLTPDVVVYTATHDNDTTRGWFETLDPQEQRRVLEYLGCPHDQVHWGLLRAAHTSVAELAVAPFQDLVGLATDARMNTPGTSGSNWSWRATSDLFTDDLSGRLQGLTEVSGRSPKAPFDAASSPPDDAAGEG